MAVELADLFQYACEKFENAKYGEALDIFVLLYMNGFEHKWILDNIYRCYMEGNDGEFRKSYAKSNVYAGISYEQCSIDFIPYQEGVYYMFDKETEQFHGKFSTIDLEEIPLDENLQGEAFNAVCLAFDWNWNNWKMILHAAKERKVYAIYKELSKGNSFCKIPELESYIKNVRIFSDIESFTEYFHYNTDVYLPKLCYGYTSDSKKLAESVQKEHLYRLTPEGRNTDNILLTIGIPTHDRGNLCKKSMENLRKMPYDAEIEFVVSKNGTRYYQEDYKEIAQIKDARLHYVGYDKELTMSENWQNVVKLAKGKYVMLVSDEDEVIWTELTHYFKLLKNNQNIGIVRPRTYFQYSSIKESKHYKKGKEAFFAQFLCDRYMSGVIYNREYFQMADIPYWNQKYRNNQFYHLYPHLWWNSLLSFLGDYIVDKCCLINEGDSALQEEYDKAMEEGMCVFKGSEMKNGIAPAVSGYQGRMEQFTGCADMIAETQLLDQKGKEKALACLALNTLKLMEMVRTSYHYKVNEFPDAVNDFVLLVLNTLDKMQTSQEGQRNILLLLAPYLIEYVENKYI